eukprot:3702115-Pyramimonas_sp.AAC.1
MERAHRVKIMGPGLTQSFVAHNRDAPSTASYIAQGFRPDKRVLEAERESHQLHANAPRHSFPPRLFCSFRGIGLPVQTGDLR